MTELWEIGQDAPFVHAARQVLKNIADGDSGARHARLATTHSGMDGNVFLPLHDGFKDRLRPVLRQISGCWSVTGERRRNVRQLRPLDADLSTRQVSCQTFWYPLYSTRARILEKYWSNTSPLPPGVPPTL